MGLNNIALDKLEKTIGAAQADPAKARKTNRVEGIWNLGEGKPQFSARLKFEGGELLLEADQPTGQGGGGTRPGPMHYCLFGLASCYTATFATTAATMGIELKELRVTAESDVNFSKAFGLSDDPIIEGVRINISVVSEAPEEKIREVEELAVQRCPAVFCMAHPIPFETKLDYHKGDNPISAEGLDEAVHALVSGYPTEEPEKVQEEFSEVLKAVLPALSRRALSAQQGGKNSAEEVWREVRHEAEGDFEGALERAERVKVLYVASKFLNNKAIGTMITEKALELAGGSSPKR